jgi:serine/threonine protein kinase
LHQPPDIPNYTILGPLGAGTSGHVWLAKDQFGERRAIKVTHLSNVNIPDYQRRFIREVNAQRMLYQVSSHVARIFDYDEQHIPPYIVMDYINGIDLNQILTSNTIAEYNLLTRLHWIEALASTLTKAHSIRIPGDSHGIIHRDIKPQNIRIQGERPYLLDFSISLTSDVEIDNTQDAMTLRYAAPEMRASAVADVFSFGLVVFEILYEVHPILTHSEAASVGYNAYHENALRKLEEGTWRFPSLINSKLPELNQSDIQKGLDKVFSKVFAINRHDRYQSPKNFSDDLLSVILNSNSTPGFQQFTSNLTTETFAVVNLDDRDNTPDPVPVGDEDPALSTRRFTEDELNGGFLPRIDVKPNRDDLLSGNEPRALETNTDTPQGQSAVADRSDITPRNDYNKGSRKISYALGLIAFSFLIVFTFILLSGNNGGDVNEIEPTAPLSGNNEVSQSTLSVTQQEQTLFDIESTATATVTPSATASQTSTATATVTSSATASQTSTATVTSSATASQTSTATVTPSATASQTSTATATVTSSATASQTSTATATVTPSATASQTSTATATATSNATASQTPTPTVTPSATVTMTPMSGQIENKILTFGEIRVVVPAIYIPEGCIITSEDIELCLDDGIWVDFNPVTNSTYDICVRTGSCSRPAYGDLFDPAGAGAENSIVGVNFAMAQRYCEFRGASMPNLVEWQILVDMSPSAFQGQDEWVLSLEQKEGQSQAMIKSETGFLPVWQENEYLDDNLTFRCSNPS